MYNAAAPFHIITEILFWSCFLVLSKAKVRTSFYTYSVKSQIGTLMDLMGKENFLFDIRLTSDWIIFVVFKKLSLYHRVYQ